MFMRQYHRWMSKFVTGSLEVEDSDVLILLLGIIFEIEGGFAFNFFIALIS